MDTVAELWETVTGPMKEAEELLRAQREMLNVADQQASAYRQVIRNLMKLCEEHKAPVLKVAAALTPMFSIGPVPADEQGPGRTEPLETDDPPVDSPEGMERAALEKRWDRDVEAIRNADADVPAGHPTLRLATLGERGLDCGCDHEWCAHSAEAVS